LFNYKKAEIAAGAFVLTGLAALAYLSISIGGLKLLPRDNYRLLARFSNVGDLKLRAPVKVAGVTIGSVEAIRLADYFAEVELAVRAPDAVEVVRLRHPLVRRGTQSRPRSSTICTTSG